MILLPEVRLSTYYKIPDLETIQQNENYLDKGKSKLFAYQEAPYHLISPGLYLGRLPTIKFHVPTDVKAIFSLSTYEELAKSITPAEWDAKGREHVFVHIPDHTADAPAEDLLRMVLKMHEYLSKRPRDSIYIHCKLGHSRSAMVCAIYLAIFGDDENFAPHNFDVTGVLEHIKGIRAYINLDEPKKNKIYEVLGLYKATLEASPLPLTPFKNSSAYFASRTAKNTIFQMIGFKELAIYATRLQSQVPDSRYIKDIQLFFDAILKAENDDWYQALKKGEGPLQTLIQSSEEDLTCQRGRHLIQYFLTELKRHLIHLKLAAPETPLSLTMRK